MDGAPHDREEGGERDVEKGLGVAAEGGRAPGEAGERAVEGEIAPGSLDEQEDEREPGSGADEADVLDMGEEVSAEREDDG